MTRPGEDLQRLVRIIEGATHDDGSVLVESPKRLPDKDTGRLREHDVVLTFTQRHHKLIVALECRDRSRKVGVPDVEAFYAKCERTGIDRGIIVSSTGFAQTGLEKAASYNIGCLSLDQAEHLDWCLAPAIEVSHRRLIHVRLGAGAERQVGAGAKLYANNATLIGPNEIRSIGLQCLKDPSAPTNGPVTQRFVDPAPAFHVVDENGERVALRTLTIDVTYEVTARLSPFEFREYVDRAEGKQLYTIALANVDCAGVEGDIVILHEGERGGQVMFVPARRRTA
jgi:hypothetical protein